MGHVEETPLSHACARGFLDIVKLLIIFQADVNFKCAVGLTILFICFCLFFFQGTDTLSRKKCCT